MRYPKVFSSPLFLSFPLFQVMVTLSSTPPARAEEREEVRMPEKGEGESDEDDEPKKSSQLSKEKIKISGYVRSLFEADNFKDGEVSHEARVEFKTKRQNGLRADIEVDFRTKSDDVQVNTAILDKKFGDGLRLKMGYDLKRFGLEYQENRLDRPTIERSLIYRKMELFNYTGRETILMLQKGGDSELYHDWSIGLNLSEAQNTSFIGNYQADLSPRVRYGFWFQAGTYHIQDGQQLVMAMVNSLWHRDSEKLWQAEWVVGLDPRQTEFESVFDDDERVYFTGINTLYGHYIWNTGEDSLMAQAGLTVISHDQRELKYNSLGCFLGLRYDVGTLRIAINAELIGTNSPVNLKKRTYDESAGRIEALYAF